MTPEQAEEYLTILSSTEGKNIRKSDAMEIINDLLGTISRLREIALAARTHTFQNRRLEKAYAELKPGDVELKPR